MEDEKIVQLYLDRDEAAICQTSLKYGSRLRTLAFGIVNDHFTAQECENDTYFKAWNSIPPNVPKSYLYPFLACITRHICLNRCRDDSRLKRDAHILQLSRELEQCIPAPDNIQYHLDETALRDAINGFLGTLDTQKRNMFLRRYWYLDSISTIAKRFSISQSSVKTTLFRIRKQLRQHLKKEGYML